MRIYTQVPVPLTTLKGKVLKALSVNTVGEVLSVSGETFTSRLGNWIYFWDKNGKKIGSRPAS